MIAIIEGCGTNIASIQFALERLGKKSLLTSDAKIIRSASHVILPGVGTAKNAMTQLQKLAALIPQLTQPVLGICLGMQLFYEFSEEGKIETLKIISGKISSFKKNTSLPIPHMGWNQLEIKQPNPLLKNIPDNSYFYYVHSYSAPVNENTIAVTKYGKPFSAIVNNKNFYGVQFHPERSGKTGEQLLKNFLELA